MADERLPRSVRREALYIFGAWTLFGLFSASQVYAFWELRGRPAPWEQVLFGSMLDAYLWALTTLLIFWLAWRVPLRDTSLRLFIPVHAAAAVGLSLLRTVILVALSHQLAWMPERPFTTLFLAQFHQYILYYCLLLGVGLALDYYHRYREGERMAERLQAGLNEARLQALKGQLHPHFLFNTLHAISSLIPTDAKPARRMVARLGDLLRTSLDHEATQEVTLREELDFLQPYIEIEQIRLGDRLAISVDIAPEVMEARVPHLILQPLVENAICHAIAPRAEGGRIEVSARGLAGRLRLTIRDDGPGIGASRANQLREGIGLANVRARLEQLYGSEQAFLLTNHPEGGLVVSLTIPIQRAPGKVSPAEAAVL
jgi:two-component system, LytTR family, sensor kinase